MGASKFVELRESFKSRCIFCYPDRKLLIEEFDNFRVLADIAPLVIGHILICPHKHYTCAAEMGTYLLTELRDIIETLKSRLTTLGMADICIFEHGRAGHCIPNSTNDISCNHAHIHVLPIRNADVEQLESNYRRLCLQNYADIITCYLRYGDYFYLENSRGMSFFVTHNKLVRPHFLRSYLYDCNPCISPADWSKANNPRFYTETVLLLKSYSR